MCSYVSILVEDNNQYKNLELLKIIKDIPYKLEIPNLKIKNFKSMVIIPVFIKIPISKNCSFQTITNYSISPFNAHLSMIKNSSCENFVK